MNDGDVMVGIGDTVRCRRGGMEGTVVDFVRGGRGGGGRPGDVLAVVIETPGGRSRVRLSDIGSVRPGQTN